MLHPGHQKAGEIVMSRFAAGQVWSYHTRPGEEDSRLTVVKVEPNERLGTLVHVRLDGVAQKNPHAPDGVSRVVHHMPFAEAAIERSVVELLDSGPTPTSWEEGYRLWREAFDKGKAGVFTITVAESVSFCEEALARARG
jgi:hypothetical protein